MPILSPINPALSTNRYKTYRTLFLVHVAACVSGHYAVQGHSMSLFLIPISFSTQGQRSRPNVPSVIWVIVLSKTHCRVKLAQNLAGTFQVIGTFYGKNTKIAPNVKGQLLPEFNDFWGSL